MSIERNVWIPVSSSMFRAAMIGMAPGDSVFVDLHIEWNNGTFGVYAQVPTEKAEGLFTAPSAGRYLIQHIKGGNYNYTKE